MEMLQLQAGQTARIPNYLLWRSWKSVIDVMLLYTVDLVDTAHSDKGDSTCTWHSSLVIEPSGAIFGMLLLLAKMSNEHVMR
jgi:hypothetical protein